MRLVRYLIHPGDLTMSAEILKLTPTTSALNIFVSIGSTISSHASYEKLLNPALVLMNTSFFAPLTRYIRQSHFMFAQRHAPTASLDHALFVANSSDKISALATALLASVNSAPNCPYYQVGEDFLPDEEVQRPEVPLLDPPLFKKCPCSPDEEVQRPEMPLFDPPLFKKCPCRCGRPRSWYCVCQSH